MQYTHKVFIVGMEEYINKYRTVISTEEESLNSELMLLFLPHRYRGMARCSFPSSGQGALLCNSSTLGINIIIIGTSPAK